MARSAVMVIMILAVGTLSAQDRPIPADQDSKTTPEGLEYSTLKRGDGKVTAELGNTVKVHYTGWVKGGSQFTDSRKTRSPASFDLIPGGRVIPGWVLGIQLMHVGDVFKFTIPPALGYGNTPQAKIPAESTLIFEVELLEATPHVTIPTWNPGDPSKQKTTPSGLKYEMLEEGTGAPPTEDEFFELKYALWTRTGTLISCDLSHTKQPITQSIKTSPMPLFGEAIPLIKVGGRYRFEAPARLCYGGGSFTSLLPPNSVTIWELEVVKILRPPDFSLSPKDKIKTTQSGLQYEVLEEGKGKTPTATDEVQVQYAGWLLDGKLFDSSFKRGQPARFEVGKVVKGWTEGLQLMKEGSVFKLTIPPEIGFGSKPLQGIPANSTLVFWVKLLEVIKK